MAILNEIFTTSRSTAIARAKAHAEGAAPTPVTDLVEATGLTDLELEILGEVIAKAVHAEGIEVELDLVDIELDDLWELSAEVVAACVELSILDTDPTASASIDAVVAEFCGEEDIDIAEAEASDLVRRVIALAVLAHQRGEALYFWWSL